MLGTAGVLFPEILSNLGTGGPAAQQVRAAVLLLHFYQNQPRIAHADADLQQTGSHGDMGYRATDDDEVWATHRRGMTLERAPTLRRPPRCSPSSCSYSHGSRAVACRTTTSQVCGLGQSVPIALMDIHPPVVSLLCMVA
jgi:hypothetical protein